MTDFIPPGDEISENVPISPLDTCWISFGGNIGDVKATFNAALALLSLHPQIQLGQRSGIYHSVPMGAQSGSPFLNSVCGLTTQLAPFELLRVLQSVENQLGRVRDIRWGPRTLDLDLLNYRNQVISEPDLTVPHPALRYRRFVLDPLVEIAPDWRHPVDLTSVQEMMTCLNRRPLRVKLVDIAAAEIAKLSIQLQSGFPQLQFVTDEERSACILPIRLFSPASVCDRALVDLSHSPGCMLEKLTSALTAIFDVPERISEW